jgi:hypothetical protein
MIRAAAVAARTPATPVVRTRVVRIPVVESASRVSAQRSPQAAWASCS